MKKRWISAVLTAAMIINMMILPAYAADTADPATTGKNAPLDFASSTTQVCPVCGGSAVQWQELPEITTNTVLPAGHYYVPAGGIENTATYTFNDNKVRCIHLNSNTLQSSTNLFTVTNNARVNVFGSGDVTSTSTTKNGAAFYLNTARVYLYGGNYSSPNATTGNTLCLDSSNANMYIYDGVSIFSAGRSIRITSAGGKLTMSGGSVSGGKTEESGGNVIVAGGSFTMSGGTISGGNASNGGNVYVAGGTFSMSDGSISGGTATGNGGNVYVASGTFKMSGGSITGGTANNGGSVGATSTNAKLSITGGSISGGTSTSHGGTLLLENGATMDMSGGSVTGGTAGVQGGTMRAFNAAVNLSGDATLYAGNTSNTETLSKGLWLVDSKLNMSGNATIYGNGTTSYGNAVFATHSSIGSTVTLSGNASIKNQFGISSNNLFLNFSDTYTNKLQVTEDWAGTAYCIIYKSADTSYALGEAISTDWAQVGTITEDTFVAGGTFKGLLYYGTNSSVSMNAADGVLYVPEKDPSNTGVNAPIDFASSTSQVCPVCGGNAVTWKPLPNITANTTLTKGHYYVPQGGITNSYQYNVKASAKVCLHLNGNTLSSSSRIFNASGDSTINIFGQGEIKSTATSTTGAVAYISNSSVHLYGGFINTPNSTTGNTLRLDDSANARLYVYDGAIITSGGRCIQIAEDGAIATISGGIIKDGSPDTNGGGNITLSAGSLIMNGGIISGGTSVSYGGNVYMSGGTFTMNGGTISSGKATDEGGNVYVSGGSFTMNSGVISGGSAANGGNISTGANGTLFITQVADSTAEEPRIFSGIASSSGGNIYLSSPMTMDGGVISDGTATAGGGGNIYTASSLELSSCVIENGKALAGNGGNLFIAGDSGNILTSYFKDEMLITGGQAKNGGNVNLSNAIVDMTAGKITNGTTSNLGGNINIGGNVTLNISGGEISDSTASSNGGNIYCGGAVSKINISGGLITGGQSNNSGTSTGGGNIFMNNGFLTMTSGVISNGRAPNAYGGNIASRAGNYNDTGYVLLDGNDSTKPAPVITGGVSKGTGGNLYVNGDRYSDEWAYVTIGNCIITEGDSLSNSYGDDISIQHSAKLTVLPTFAGEADIYISTCCLPASVMGGQIDTATGSAQGAFPGKLVLEQYPEKYYLIGKDGATGLYICDSGVRSEDGTYTWLLTNEESLIAAKEQENCVVLAAPGEMSLDGGSYFVDLRGNNVHFTGTGTVTLVDSTNDTFETFGTATCEEGVMVNTGLAEAYGNHYYTIATDNIYSAHRITNELVWASLRPSAAGIYFTGKWECDDTLAAYIDNYGVAVSVYAEPNADFVNDGHSKWTSFDQASFTNGVEKTGVLITNILKDTSANRIANNAKFAQMPIFATAYITIEGNRLMGNTMSYSLKNIMDFVNENIDTYYEDASAMQSFMEKWRTNGLDGSDWDMDFTPSADALYLNAAYADTNVYHGEFHDHADTGGTSDGKATLAQIKEHMAVKGIDFTTILDHRQILHMELEDWDDTIMIGGSESASWITGGPSTGNKLHINMIFSDKESFIQLMENHMDGIFDWKLDETTGTWHYSYNAHWTTDNYAELINDVRKYGGMFVWPHPKDGTRYISDDPMDYYFTDWMGFEVFYGPSRYAPNEERSLNAYNAWTAILKNGGKIWATAGSDSHSVPNTNALTTIYAEEKHASSYLEHARMGDMTCGPIGIRMCMTDAQTGELGAVTGGLTSFDGKRLSICVSDFHESVVFDGHRYRVDVIAGKDGTEEVVHSEYVSPDSEYFWGLDADTQCDYYRIELYDEDDARITNGMPTAIGNPIWNEK